MKPMLIKFLNGEGDTNSILTSFVNFKKEIRHIFSISNKDKVAICLI